jgi:hypothetical protein
MPDGTSIAGMEQNDTRHEYYGNQAIWNLQTRFLIREGDLELNDTGANISFSGTGAHIISGNTSGLKLALNDYNGAAEINSPVGVRMGDGYGDQDSEDLSSVSGDFVGQTKMNDGTTGNQGPHWWDGSVWNQMDDWSSTIDPSAPL